MARLTDVAVMLTLVLGEQALAQSTSSLKKLSLDELMQVYVEQAKRRRFAAEARRQSRLITGSKDETEVLHWIEDVSNTEGWE